MTPPRGSMDGFRAVFGGRIVTPDDQEYDGARKVWNGTIDRRPAAIATCASTDDVVAGISFARENDLVTAIRCGGHSAGGLSTCDDGLVLDLSGLRGVAIDPGARVARVGGGCLLGELDRAAQEHELVTPVGVVSHTGVAGLTLGGGVGRLQRKHGLTIDNLLSIDLVTADGKLLRASEDENPDLFWAMRGAGHNFGVAVSFEFRLHHLGTTLGMAVNVYPLERAAEALRAYADWTAQAPDEVTTMAALMTMPAQPPFPEHLHGTRGLMIGASHAGSDEQFARLADGLREVGSPDTHASMRVPYLAVQQMADEVYAWGKRYYLKGSLIRELTADTIDVIVDHAASAPGPHAEIALLQMGGAVARVPEDATAYSGRSAPFFFDAESAWTDPAEDVDHMQWVRRIFDRMRPSFADGNYVNVVEGTGEEAARETYGSAKFERLRELKRTYDPTNFFRLNNNIPV